MGDDTNGSIGATTTVTKVTREKDTGEVPLMSYTAVTTHKGMAEAFMAELLRVGRKVMPDHELTVEDLVSIAHLAMDERGAGVVMLEGRHLRGRISEQVSRSSRYDETFSLVALDLTKFPDQSAYDSVLDTLVERLRKTDLLFTFKSRIFLLLPHTGSEACECLIKRIDSLLEISFNGDRSLIGINHLTYPNDDMSGSSAVLDWAEDQLR